MLVLKSSLDTGKEAQIAQEICERFFPSMGADPALVEKFRQLANDFQILREVAGDRFFTFYNKIEAQVLLGERTPD